MEEQLASEIINQDEAKGIQEIQEDKQDQAPSPPHIDLTKVNSADSPAEDEDNADFIGYYKIKTETKEKPTDNVKNDDAPQNDKQTIEMYEKELELLDTLNK